METLRVLQLREFGISNLRTMPLTMKTTFECMECSKVFTRLLVSVNNRVKCPRCKSHDVEVIK